jgi:hypothetical protein
MSLVAVISIKFTPSCKASIQVERALGSSSNDGHTRLRAHFSSSVTHWVSPGLVSIKYLSVATASCALSATCCGFGTDRAEEMEALSARNARTNMARLGEKRIDKEGRNGGRYQLLSYSTWLAGLDGKVRRRSQLRHHGWCPDTAKRLCWVVPYHFISLITSSN